MEKYVEVTMQNLQKNNIKPFYVETKEEVLPLVKTLLKKGEVVAAGGSVSLDECGVYDYVSKSGEYDFADRSGLQGEQLRKAYGKAFMSDTFFCSSNAVTQRGELYNVDGNSNRIACIAYGPKQVIMVVGVNKIVENIDEAVKRVKEKAAPPNCVRLNINNPCQKLGKCVSLSFDDPFICDGCGMESRICCNYLITAKQRHVDRIKVILVNENLGY